MAITGRRHKPTHLKIIEGNRGNRPLPADEVKPPVDKPSAPQWLTDEAKKEWRYIVPRLDSLGILTKIDRTTLEVYCEAVATHREATDWIAKKGILVSGRKGEAVKNPALQVQRDAARLIATYSRMFGFSPADRAGLDGGGGILATGDAALSLARVLSGNP